MKSITVERSNILLLRLLSAIARLVTNLVTVATPAPLRPAAEFSHIKALVRTTLAVMAWLSSTIFAIFGFPVRELCSSNSCSRSAVTVSQDSESLIVCSDVTKWS